MSAKFSKLSGLVDRLYNPLSDISRKVFDEYDSVFQSWMRAMDRLVHVLWLIAISLSAVLVVLVTAQVVTRYLFEYVPIWGGELSSYLAIWAALLLIPALIWGDRNLQVEFVFERMSLRMRRRYRSLQLIVFSLFTLAFTYYGWDYAATSGFRSTSTTIHHLVSLLPLVDASWRLDMFWVYLILPLSGILMTIACITKLVQINYNPAQIQSDYSLRYGADIGDE